MTFVSLGFIVKEVKSKHKQQGTKTMSRFKIGDRVQNTTNDNRFDQGTITAIRSYGVANVSWDDYGMEVSWSLKLMVKL